MLHGLPDSSAIAGRGKSRQAFARPGGTAMASVEKTNRMHGRVAIVTGAGSRSDGIGNGRAASVLLARHGAKVALIDTERDWVETTHAMIKQEGSEAFVHIADV